jgi:hypothetical protein
MPVKYLKLGHDSFHTFFPLYYSLIILSFVNAIYYELMSKLLNKQHINKQREYKYKI